MPNAAARRTTRRVLLCPFADILKDPNSQETRNTTELVGATVQVAPSARWSTMHQRLVAFTQCYFTTLDRRRTLRTLRDCGLSRLKALATLLRRLLEAEVRQNALPP